MIFMEKMDFFPAKFHMQINTYFGDVTSAFRKDVLLDCGLEKKVRNFLPPHKVQLNEAKDFTFQKHELHFSKKRD